MEKIDTIKQMLEKIFEIEAVLRNYKYKAFDAAIKLANSMVEDGIVEFDTAIKATSYFNDNIIWINKINCSDISYVTLIDINGKEHDMTIMEFDIADVVDSMLQTLSKKVLEKSK